jgi:DNA-binding cell septation regulator SpoVG
MSTFSDVSFNNKGATGNILGRGSFVVGGSVKVQYTLFSGKNGPFVMLPAEKDRNGKTDPKTGRPVYYPHASFITADARQEINDLVMGKYNEAQGGVTTDTSTSQVSDDLPF